MTVAWPLTVNQKALISGSDEKPEDTLATYKPAVGGPIKRRRSYVPSTLMTFTQLLTFTEWDAFNDWYDNVLLNGTQWFTRGHPRKGPSVQITAQFDTRPESGTPVSGTQYMVPMTMRVYS